MPTISVFYGIVIAMFFNDHDPPHFHAATQSTEDVIAIASGELLDGDLPARVIRMVAEWAGLHRGELEANWSASLGS